MKRQQKSNTWNRRRVKSPHSSYYAFHDFFWFPQSATMWSCVFQFWWLNFSQTGSYGCFLASKLHVGLLHNFFLVYKRAELLHSTTLSHFRRKEHVLFWDYLYLGPALRWLLTTPQKIRIKSFVSAVCSRRDLSIGTSFSKSKTNHCQTFTCVA